MNGCWHSKWRRKTTKRHKLNWVVNICIVNTHNSFWFYFCFSFWIKGLCSVYSIVYTVIETRKYSNYQKISIKSEMNAWEIRIRHQHENLRTNIKSIDTRNYSAILYAFYFDWKLSCEKNKKKTCTKSIFH